MINMYTLYLCVLYRKLCLASLFHYKSLLHISSVYSGRNLLESKCGNRLPWLGFPALSLNTSRTLYFPVTRHPTSILLLTLLPDTDYLNNAIVGITSLNTLDLRCLKRWLQRVLLFSAIWCRIVRWPFTGQQNVTSRKTLLIITQLNSSRTFWVSVLA
jgi:hypothetical protein